MTEIILISILYIILSLTVASQAKKSRLSFIQLLLLSLFLTPIIGLVFFIKTKKGFSYYVYQYKCPRCKYFFTENNGNCPHCEKDGYKVSLKKEKKIMT